MPKHWRQLSAVEHEHEDGWRIRWWEWSGKWHLVTPGQRVFAKNSDYGPRGFGEVEKWADEMIAKEESK